MICAEEELCLLTVQKIKCIKRKKEHSFHINHLVLTEFEIIDIYIFQFYKIFN